MAAFADRVNPQSQGEVLSCGNAEVRAHFLLVARFQHAEVERYGLCEVEHVLAVVG